MVKVKRIGRGKYLPELLRGFPQFALSTRKTSFSAQHFRQQSSDPSSATFDKNEIDTKIAN
jgi:hypothetical protein